MPRRRRHLPRLPDLHLRSQLELNRAPLNHDIFVFEPVLVPRLPVDLDALHVVAAGSLVQPRRSYPERLVTVDGHVEVREPGRGEQVDGLRDDWVDAQHVPQEPGVHSASVAVAGDAVGSVFEAGGFAVSFGTRFAISMDFSLLLIGEAATALDTLRLLVDVVVEIGCRKVRLVPEWF